MVINKALIIVFFLELNQVVVKYNVFLFRQMETLAIDFDANKESNQII